MNRTLLVRIGVATLMLSALAIVTSAASTEWFQWLGPNRDGVSPETGLLKAWPKGDPTELWKADGVGDGYATVTTDGKNIYTTGDKGDELHLLCVGVDGKTVYDKVIGKAWTGAPGKWPGSRGAPMLDGDYLYVESAHGQVTCHKKADGTQVWKRDFKDWGARAPSWGFAETPLGVGDNVVVTPGGKTGLVALNKKTGKTAWETDTRITAQYCSPIYVEYKGAKMVIQGSRSGLIGVDATNGKTLWTNNFGARNVANCPSPRFKDGIVFWSIGYGKGCVGIQLDVSGGKVTAKELYRNRNMVSHVGGFVIVGDYVYGNHNNGWTCLDLKTGEAKWTTGLVGKGSIVAADGMLYLYSENGGKAGLVPASPDGAKLVGEFSVPGPRGVKTWAYPSISDDRLYLRYGDTVHCYDIKASE